MHEIMTILADVRGISLSVMWLKSAAACAVYATCHVHLVQPSSQYFDQFFVIVFISVRV